MGFCIGRFSCRLGAVLGGIGTVSEASWAVLGLSSGPLGPFRSVVKLKGGESGGILEACWVGALDVCFTVNSRVFGSRGVARSSERVLKCSEPFGFHVISSQQASNIRLFVRCRSGAVQWKCAYMQVRMGTSTSGERSRRRNSCSAEEVIVWQSGSVSRCAFVTKHP